VAAIPVPCVHYRTHRRGRFRDETPLDAKLRCKSNRQTHILNIVLGPWLENFAHQQPELTDTSIILVT